jgi:uncharacterized membrane protein
MSEPTIHNRTSSPAGPSPDLVRKVELLISNLLRFGVVTSLVVVVIGLVISFLHHSGYIHSRAELQQVTSPAHPAWHTLGELATGLAHGRGEAIIMAGLLLLIATPVMRVAVSIVAFLVERDWVFAIVTAFVLAMLILSFVLGKAEG